MTWQRKNSKGSLVIAVACGLAIAFANPSTGQQFVAPPLPLGQTVGGQTYGDPTLRTPQTQSFPAETFQGTPSQNQAFQGRVFEGRVLTGPDGQPGDMTLRFPDSPTSAGQSPEAELIFGPIDIPAQSPANSSAIQNYPRRRPASSNPGRRRAGDLSDRPDREIIRQRYPDGNVHIARHVMQDAQGNWVNDGQWKLFDQQGAMIASGSYQNGAMDGKWSRLHTAGSGGIFDNLPFIEFEGPYASHANFESGKLSGTWVIEDRQGQKIFEMPYKNGRRDGVAVWHLPQGKIYRRMEFKKDVPVGNLVEYDNQGKILRKETYKDGMKIVNNVSYYRPSGQKRQESIVRRGRLELQGEDDWWEARPAPMVVTGQDVQHGPIRSWYENGQTKMVGNLVQGLRVGQFIWWHPNGSKQLMGQYDRSGKKTGSWRWWHANGIKSIDGHYTDGQPDATWQWWNDQGELVNEEDFDPNAKRGADDDTGLESLTESAISIDLGNRSNDSGSPDVSQQFNAGNSANQRDGDGGAENPNVGSEKVKLNGSVANPEAGSILESDASNQGLPDQSNPIQSNPIQGDSNQRPASLPGGPIDTQTLEGIEPESFNVEEIPQPRQQGLVDQEPTDSQTEDLRFEFDDTP